MFKTLVGRIFCPAIGSGCIEKKIIIAAEDTITPIHYADGVLRFETITFHGPAKPGEVNGKPVNLAPSRGYDSPFIRSDWGSGLIRIRKGDETVILDFRDPQNPTKTTGAPATAEFPPGVGNAQPVIFGKAAR